MIEVEFKENILYTGMRFLSGSADFEIPGGDLFFLIENLTLECIKTAAFDTRNPKSPYRGRGASPIPTPTPRSVATLPRRSVNSLPR